MMHKCPKVQWQGYLIGCEKEFPCAHPGPVPASHFTSTSAKYWCPSCMEQYLKIYGELMKPGKPPCGCSICIGKVHVS